MNQPLSTTFLRRALIALVVLGFSPVLIPLVHAQPSPAASDTNTPAAAPATPAAAPAAATTAATGTATPPAATDSSAKDQATNSAPLSPAAVTNAAPADAAPAPGDTNAPSSEMEGPGPGAMAAPALELIGPPAPGSPNSMTGQGAESANPLNNPAVTDVTNNPGAVAGLGQRKIPFYFGLNLGEMYDDNILIAPSNDKKSAWITHTTPSIDYQMGNQDTPHSNYLNLFFAPSVYIYDNRDRLNRIDYNGDIYYQYSWTRLTLGFEQNYQHLTDATLDEGTLVSRNIYTTKLTSSYAYNDDLNLFGTATQTVNNYPGITINEWDIDTYALYQIAPKLSIGAGPRFCFLDITGAPNETHQDLLLRLRYVPDQFFTVSFEGGLEYLEYQSSEQGTQASRILPIFDGNISYSPFMDTYVFADASRATVNSYDQQGDTIDSNRVQLGAGQRFLQHFNAVATAGYNFAQYQGSGTGVIGGSGEGSGSARQDNYFYAKGTLEWDPNKWLQVQGIYQWSHNNSTSAQFSFTDNQIDLQSTVKF